MGRHAQAGIRQRTLDRLRTLFSAQPERRPPLTDFETHTGADDTMATTRFLHELTATGPLFGPGVATADFLADEDELGGPVRYETIDRIRELSYGPDALPNLAGIPGEDWEYAMYRKDPHTGVYDFVRLGAYRMEHRPLKSALGASHWPDDVATRIRSTWLEWNAEYALPESWPLFACLVRPAETQLWTGRDLGGEM
jgi:hypothetical protein